jgi:hypothetical protein
MSNQRIDPARIKPELVEAGAHAVLRENGIEPDGYEGPAHASTRTALAYAFSALLADEEAWRRAAYDFIEQVDARNVQEALKRAVIAAVTEPEGKR